MQCSGFDILIAMLFSFLIFSFIISVFVVRVLIPFLSEKTYIKMEIGRSIGREKIYWEKELKKLYISLIPIIGRHIYKIN